MLRNVLQQKKHFDIVNNIDQDEFITTDITKDITKDITSYFRIRDTICMIIEIF